MNKIFPHNMIANNRNYFYLCTQNQVTWIWLIGVKVYY